MKIRDDFVSNSSSSSFIVWMKSDENNKKPSIDAAKLLLDSVVQNNADNIVCIPNIMIGETQFGWEFVYYEGFGTKLNFCAIQCYDAIEENKTVEDSTYWKQLMDALHHLFGDEFKFVFNYKSIYNYDSYIDHQSSSCEGQNVEMFESVDKLIDFLISPSYIEGGNDNS